MGEVPVVVGVPVDVADGSAQHGHTAAESSALAPPAPIFRLLPPSPLSQITILITSRTISHPNARSTATLHSHILQFACTRQLASGDRHCTFHSAIQADQPSMLAADLSAGGSSRSRRAAGNCASLHLRQRLAGADGPKRKCFRDTLTKRTYSKGL